MLRALLDVIKRWGLDILWASGYKYSLKRWCFLKDFLQLRKKYIFFHGTTLESHLYWLLDNSSAWKTVLLSLKRLDCFKVYNSLVFFPASIGSKGRGWRGQASIKTSGIYRKYYCFVELWHICSS